LAGTRKIAAILVADIVGYSRLAGADERWSLGFAQTAMALADAPDAHARIQGVIDAANGLHQVVRVLPVKDVSSQTYRIKSKAELFERSAKEYEILAVSLPPTEGAATVVERPGADPMRRRRVSRPFLSR